MSDLADLLRRQSGVVNRHQVLDSHGTDDDIERRLRRREWARVHHGVYVDHTGRPTWDQRAWAAVLYHWPAVLSGRAALRAHGIRVDGEVSLIELLIARGRRVSDPCGLRTGQSSIFADVALMHLSPPRVRIEHAVLQVASDASTVDSAVAVIGDACQQGRTTANRLLDTLALRQRLPRRALLREVLTDVADGSFSALERRYLHAVERGHGLPRSRRQRRVVQTDGRAAYRDVEFEDFGVVIELDGRAGHESAADRWGDLERDLYSAANGAVTIRLGWRQVLSPCHTAATVARILAARGWVGHPKFCGPGCQLSADGRDPSAPGAGKSPPNPPAPRRADPSR